MTDVFRWADNAAGNNQGAPPDFPTEGMPPAGVNDVARENMAAIKRWQDDTSGVLDSTGSGGSYTLTPKVTRTAHERGATYVFKANHANTGAVSVTIGSLPAANVRTPTGAALSAGAILSGQIVEIVYDGANYQITSSQTVATVAVVDTAALKALTPTNGDLVNFARRGVYQFNSTSTATADDVLIIQPNAGGGRWLLQHDGKLPVTTWGTTRAAIQSAITWAATNSGYLFFPPATTYVIDQTLSVTSGNDFTLDFGNAKFDCSSMVAGDTFLQLLGSLGTARPLTANAAQGQPQLTMTTANAANFSANSRVLVYSNAIWRKVAGGTSADSEVGEFASVASVVGGTVNLKQNLLDAYTTADAAAAAPVTMIRNATIRGGHVFSANPATTQHIGVHARYCENIKIERGTYTHFGNRNLWLQSCLIGKVTNCHIANAEWETGYGVAVGDASQHVLVHANTFERNRHHFTTTSSTGVRGITRFVTVSNNECYGTEDATTGSGDALDTHVGSEYINFIDNQVYDCQGAGVNFECTSGKINGNTIVRTTGQGIIARNKSKKGGSLEISDNKVEFTGGVGVQVIRSVSVPTAPLFDSLTVTGNDIKSPGAGLDGILIDGNGVVFDAPVIEGNKAKGVTGAGEAIRLVNCDDASFSGNTGTAAVNCFQFNACNRVAASGNTAAAGAAGIAYYFSGTGEGNNLGVNTAKPGANYGVWFDNTQSFNSAALNTLRGMLTAPVRAGTGTGHQTVNNIT
ncbi:MAG: right-handed parallel beta-helix repeat-containing protein [Pseudomonadota bacterium]